MAQFGEQWKEEMMKLKKEDIIDMYEIAMRHKTIIPSEGGLEAMYHLEGIINDYDNVIINKEELMSKAGEWVSRLMHIFWKRAKKAIRNNPELLNED